MKRFTIFGKDTESLGLTHFIGIGGVGMSAIAELMHAAGFEVQGSDRHPSRNVERLQRHGVKVFPTHIAQNLEDAFRVVVSTSIAQDNPEVLAAKDRGIRIIHRSELLAEILTSFKSVAVSGTHGKSTTTALCYHLLKEGQKRPSVIAGATINELNSNAESDEGEWLVAEADESDGTFLRYRPHVSIVTSIDAEHVDFYTSMDSLRGSYEQFVSQTSKDGLAVLCVDHPEVAALAAEYEGPKCTYGIKEAADVRASQVRQEGLSMVFTLHLAGQTYENVKLKAVGVHNVLNALAAIAVAHFAGVEVKEIIHGLSTFGGVRRRFSILKETPTFTLVDDYAHHPVEIHTTLKAAKRGFPKRKIVAVMEPHRYSRLKAFGAGFAKALTIADEVYITPVYSSGERPITGVDEHSLAKAVKKAGGKNVKVLKGEDDFLQIFSKRTKEEMVLLCMGAGSISAWAHHLMGEV